MAQETDDFSKKKDSIYESVHGHPPKVKHFSVGAKIGIPLLAGGSAEIVLPFLNNHFAPFVDYNYFSFKSYDFKANLSLSSLGFGAKYYLGEKGNGFFISVGRSSLKADITFNDLPLLDENSEKQYPQVSVDNSVQANTLNFKFGIKTEGTVYFLLELGYGVGVIPGEIEFTAISGDIIEVFTEKIPTLTDGNGILIANVGFGFAF